MIYLIIKVDALSQDQGALLIRLMNAVNIDKFEIINIKFYRLKDKSSFHICFGEAAYQACKIFLDNNLEKLIKVSDLDLLSNLPKNSDSRAETYYTLKGLEKHIGITSKVSVNPNNILSSINSINLEALKLELINNNINGFTTLDSTGKRIRIYLNKKDIDKEDINISIDELIVLKLISEVFNINNPITIQKEIKGEDK